MIKLSFKINKYYLLVNALSQIDLPFPEWVNLQNMLWEKYPRAFYLLTNHSEVAFIGNAPLEEFIKTQKETKKMLKDAFKTKEFQRLYDESKKYLIFLKKEWVKNREEALKILKELSGLDLPNKNITVLITHPNLYRGFALPPYNVMGFGFAEDWKNSSTVYLCHELMHYITKNTRTMHALIKLMTDNELRIRLNKKGKYFIFQNPPEQKDSPLYTYFNQLRDLEKKIYPYWKEYLKNQKGRNIIDLEKEIIKKIKKH